MRRAFRFAGRSARAALTTVLVVLVLVPTAGAQAVPAEPGEGQAGEPRVPWFRTITLNGFLSSSFVHNFNHPASHTNQFRAFDGEGGKAVFDVAEFVVQRAVDEAGQAGFRVDLTFGRRFSDIIASPDLFRRDDGAGRTFDVHQAFLTYIVRVGSGLRIDVGKFVTHLGYEVVDGYDGFNENGSRSWRFTYAEPATHTGLKVGYAVNDKLALRALLVNGWDLVGDNNGGKSVGAQVEIAPSGRVTTWVNYMVGPEQDASANLRQAIDWTILAEPTARLTIVGDYEYGREAGVALAQTAGGGVRDASWQGVAGYARYSVSELVAASVRCEQFSDPDGARTGYAQTLREVTFTPELRLGPHLVVRADLRHDRSNRDVFERRDGGDGRVQTTLGVNALVVF